MAEQCQNFTEIYFQNLLANASFFHEKLATAIFFQNKLAAADFENFQRRRFWKFSAADSDCTQNWRTSWMKLGINFNLLAAENIEGFEIGGKMKNKSWKNRRRVTYGNLLKLKLAAT